jgi:hypothetical protein
MLRSKPRDFVTEVASDQIIDTAETNAYSEQSPAGLRAACIWLASG